LDFLNDNFSGEIYFVFGNMDDDHLTGLWHSHPERSEGSQNIATRFFANAQNDYKLIKYKKTLIFKNVGEINIENKSIAFTHYPEEAEKLAQTGKYNFVFHGHTHRPWTEKIHNAIILNPGNVAGEIYPPTFAVWNTETDHFELIRVHDLK
jgi:predicted phosphodiesterase